MTTPQEASRAAFEAPTDLLPDALIDAHLNLAYASSGLNGGMVGVQWDRIVARRFFSLAMATVAGIIEMPAAAAQARDAEALPLTDGTVRDLSLLVTRMARRLTKDGPALTNAGDQDLARLAMDFLRRKGLTSPLRDGAPVTSEPHQ